MTDYKPGTMVRVTYKDVAQDDDDRVGLIRRRRKSSELLEVAYPSGGYDDLEDLLRAGDKVRPLVVLDLRDRAHLIRELMECARTGGLQVGYGTDLDELADMLIGQIEAQTKPPKPRCVAHGDEECTHCSRISSSDLTGDGGCKHCEVYASDGMHWDTCPGRIRGVIFPTRDAAALSEGVQP